MKKGVKTFGQTNGGFLFDAIDSVEWACYSMKAPKLTLSLIYNGESQISREKLYTLLSNIT